MTNNGNQPQSEWVAVSQERLDREDSVMYDDRIARLSWMAERLSSEKYVLEIGGLLGKSLFEEMRYCFAYSQFIAASLLGLAYIERYLAAYFYGIGIKNLQRAPLTRLLAEAQAHGLVSEDQRQELDRIRQSRNAYAHFRPFGHDQGVEYRALTEDTSFYEIIEKDAIAVVEAALWISANQSL